MTEQQLDALGPALDDFLQPYLFCCGYTQSFAHLHTYCKGLLSDLQRKTCEPIALASGCAVRTLQEFLKDHLWQFADVRQQLQSHVADLLPTLPDDDVGTVGLIDETSALKSGSKTPGVQRQYLGCVGKLANGIVTVHLGVCKGRYKTLFDAELFLSQEWAADKERRRQAGIPEDMVYRPKWQIALEQVDRAVAQKVVFDWLTFDEEYGKAPEFVTGLDGRSLRFVGEVPKILSCLAATKSPSRPAAAVKGRPAAEVVRTTPAFLKQRGQKVKLAQQTGGQQVWEVKAAPVWQRQDGRWSVRTYWLIWAKNVATGEEKYFLSNAAATVAVERLVRVAFRRWNVEHGLRVVKSEIGFTHYEGRNYTALLRHQTLCLLMLSFVAEHTERLRGEKRGVDDGAGVQRLEPVVRGVAGKPAGDKPASVSLGDDQLPSAAQPGGAGVASETVRQEKSAA
jgi:SRSO17 transposase